MNKPVQELFKLVSENPTLKIIAQVDSEVTACGDDYSFYIGELGLAKIEYIYQDDDYSFIGEEDIQNHLEELLEEEMGYENEKLVQEAENRFKELILSGEIEKKIIIYIGV
jgi:hypothetical protein